ncbi:hypothetical protein [Paenibacillus sp. Marseille-Q7038]
MEQKNEEKFEHPDKTTKKKIEPVTISELFTLGRKPAENLVYLLFWTGMIGIIYLAIEFGKYIAENFPYMKIVSRDLSVTTRVETDNVLLGFVAGAIGLGVLFVLWKVCCELLLLVFKSLQKYVGSDN